MTVRTTTSTWVPNDLARPETWNQIAESWCSPGETVTGGGYDGRFDGRSDPAGTIAGLHPSVQVGADRPISDATGRQGWQLAGYNYHGTQNLDVVVYAICAAP